jgi:hypothetical protein
MMSLLDTKRLSLLGMDVPDLNLFLPFLARQNRLLNSSDLHNGMLGLSTSSTQNGPNPVQIRPWSDVAMAICMLQNRQALKIVHLCISRSDICPLNEEIYTLASSS